jgi:RNA polymerase sigma-70 factor (sigma-E family)
VDRKEERAFEQFVAESGDSLLRLATLLTSDQGLGEDVYQETMHRVADRWSRVDNPAAFCRRVMHNIVIDQGRARRRKIATVLLTEGHDDIDPRSGDSTAAAELRPALLGALRTLTPHQREMVVLRYFDDRTESEIAELLGVTTGTVKSTVSRALAQLREQPGISGLFMHPAVSTTMGKVRYA